ncbi:MULTISPECIES: ACT domain-containing protein [Corallincola]|uniref:ACT domain-containing protein n=3 Tax=Corallincola TaxID=1775176 RepID=A0A368NG66_9GAMM|nr:MULTISPECIES: ACT domain-containing protein [Corallincola]RCU49562.1 ACT domain-containing protein [Corallincola holothuriorum]TAA47857.1 ACT domain-containing protein [Corallincola spongiicola]TCI01991.1 ACT domain-containing protein [Corallincola luteus]
MSAISDLDTLLKALSPSLSGVEYVFCHVGDAAYGDYADLFPVATFREKEGLTLVITKTEADVAEMGYQGVFRCITLDVHSSLEAVGLTAVVSSKLAEQGISANVIAAYYHDHVFVPVDRADDALAILNKLTT